MLKIHRNKVRKELRFSYPAVNRTAYCYVSNPETGTVVLKKQISGNNEHNINVEHFPSGIYNIIIVDGEQLIKCPFEKP